MTPDNKPAAPSQEAPMRIRVEVKNEILGDSIFWEGSADRVHEIRNIPARQTAKLVAKDGKKRICGMWHVSALARTTGA